MFKRRQLIQLLMLSIILMIFPVSLVLADEQEERTGLEISPNDHLFNIFNMKPGDWATRTIKVSNTSEEPFEYTFMIDNVTGETLFSKLLFEIYAGDHELYHGKLKDYPVFSPRLIQPQEHEELTMTIRFPEHLGNEFQGLNTNFSFVFIAEGALEQTLTYIDSAIGSGTSVKSGFFTVSTTIIAGLVILLLCLANAWLIYQFYRKSKAHL